MKMKEDPVISLSLDENSDPVLLENARNYLSRTLNRLMMVELTEFLGYEKSARSKQPNARNGFYRRPLKTPLGLIEVKIPVTVWDSLLHPFFQNILETMRRRVF